MRRRVRSSVRRRRWVFALLASTALVLGVVGGPTAAGAYTSTTDVVYVHGYGACQDVLVAGAGPLQSQYYYQHQSADKLHSVAYYGCDTNGDRIAGYGPRNKDYFPSPDGDSYNTDIRHIGYELAWYLYDRYTAKGLPVDVVAHSMGGLITAWALQRVAAGDPLFPPKLVVKTVVTFSTPFTGFDFPCSPATLQCTQLNTGSALTTQIAAAGGVQMSGGTFWVTVGSSGCDVVPAASAGGLRGAAFVVTYTSPCYDHNAYVWDGSLASDTKGTLNGQPFSGGVHSLALMAWALL